MQRVAPTPVEPDPESWTTAQEGIEAKMGTEASFVVNTMYNDKSLMGCRYGSARPAYDIPLMVDLYKAGQPYRAEPDAVALPDRGKPAEAVQPSY